MRSSGPRLRIVITAAFFAAAAAACGSIVGIEPLGVRTDHGTEEVDASPEGIRDSGKPGAIVIPESDAEAGTPVPPTRVPDGTYGYTVADGSHDQLSGPGFGHTSPHGPASLLVTRLSESCFKQTLTLRNGYDETMDNFCVSGLELVQSSGERTQSFPFIGAATTNQTCTPGDVYYSSAPLLGREWTHDCTGNNADNKSGDTSSTFRTTGPYRYVAKEMQPLGNGTTSALVYHFKDTRQVTGAQTGTNTADWSFEVGTGLLVRLVRSIHLTYNSPIGTIKYDEETEVTLTSLPPRP